MESVCDSRKSSVSQWFALQSQFWATTIQQKGNLHQFFSRSQKVTTRINTRFSVVTIGCHCNNFWLLPYQYKTAKCDFFRLGLALVSTWEILSLLCFLFWHQQINPCKQKVGGKVGLLNRNSASLQAIRRKHFFALAVVLSSGAQTLGLNERLLHQYCGPKCNNSRISGRPRTIST